MEAGKDKINWYRIPIDRKTMRELTRRSDWLGLTQVLGHLGLVCLTGIAAFYAVNRLPLACFLLILFLHGTFYSFLYNGTHELSHYSVFKTRWLNQFFLTLLSFMVWRSHILFLTSHTEHHKYTLHPPHDLEVVLPVKVTLKSFLKSAIINPWMLYDTIKAAIRLSSGKLEGEWEMSLFPTSDREKRFYLFNWARLLLFGHLLIIIFSWYRGLWLIPLLITLAPFYGGGLRYLCNNTQHTGLEDNVADFRLCCRTVILNPFVSFLYWHMNYHTEHHMYAAVPCYHLGRLHQLIRAQMPRCPKGLVSAWTEIIMIRKKQATDPQYQHRLQLPNPAMDSTAN